MARILATPVPTILATNPSAGHAAHANLAPKCTKTHLDSQWQLHMAPRTAGSGRSHTHHGLLFCTLSAGPSLALTAHPMPENDSPSIVSPSSPPHAPQHEPALATAPSRFVYWLRNFLPAPVGTNATEGLRMAVGACIGLLVTALISRWWGSHEHASWMLASVGASAALVFGMPASPLAQPWPVLTGSVLCLLAGSLCVTWVPDEAVALALAVGLSVAVMVPLRCFHPPAIGLATFVVLEHGQGLDLLVFPLIFNILVLLACAVVYNRITGRAYPHPQRSLARNVPAGGQFTTSDLDAALTHYNQVLDISRADLEGLLHLAGRAAFQRTLGDLRCADVMSKPVFAVEQGVALKDAWTLMRNEQVKAIPVVDAQHQVVGIVSHADFMRNANLDTHEGLGQRLKSLVMGKARSKTPQTVDDLMAHPVQTVQTLQHVIELVPLFSAGGHHHLPVVDPDNRLVGIITQTDLIRVLATTVAPEPSRGPA